MKVGKFYLDFEHHVDERYTAAILYDDPNLPPIAEVISTVWYKDHYSRKAGRRACLRKLLDPKAGPFAGDDLRAERADLWAAYWEVMPNDRQV